MKGKFSKLRLKLFYFVRKNRFESFILVLICISCINMGLDDPLMDPNSALKLFLFYLDLVITSIYALEAILKITAYGFINKNYSYIRDSWNIVDFFSLIISL